MSAELILIVMAAGAGPDLQAVLDGMRADQQVPGISAVVTHREDVVFAGASGLADLESGREMTVDTVLYAGSLSKILTAVLTLRLAEEGRLSLDDVVAGIAHESSIDKPRIKVRHLLTHASGLDREGNFGYWFSADFPDAGALARHLVSADLATPPGTSFRYSNIGYAALAPVIERASGVSYHDALHERVLEPLGMDSSGAPGPVPGIATGYTPVGRVIPSEKRAFAGVGRRVGERRVREYHDAKAMAPAFGAFTSANDLGRLVRFLLGHGGDKVLSTDMRSTMLTSQNSGWGLGIRLGRLNGRPIAHHSGWFAAHRSHLLLDLQAGIGVVVLANSDGASPDEVAEALIAGTLDYESARYRSSE